MKHLGVFANKRLVFAVIRIVVLSSAMLSPVYAPAVLARQGVESMATDSASALHALSSAAALPADRWFPGGVRNDKRNVNILTSTSAPANDDFGSATAISSMPYRSQQDIYGATAAADDPILSCVSDRRSATVWYRLTPATDGLAIVSTSGSDYDTVLGLWTGSRGSLASVNCNDDENGDVVTSRLSSHLAAGTTYYIEVAAYWEDGSGNLTLNVSFVRPPVNDTIANAIVISSVPFSNDRDTLAATVSGDEPTFGCSSDQVLATVWYRFRPASSSVLTISTVGSDYPTVLGVWSGLPGRLTSVDCSRNYATSESSRITASFKAGTTYYIGVAAYRQPGGNLDLSLSSLPPSLEATSLVAPTTGNIGQTVPVSWIVRNHGSGNAVPPWSDKLYLSTDNAWSHGDAALGVVPHTIPLASGGSYDAKLNVTLPRLAGPGTWTERAGIPTRRLGFGVAAVGGKIYAIGGDYGRQLNTVEEYDPAANRWSSRAGMPTPRAFLGAAAVDGKLYAIGGWNNGSSVGTVEEYDPTTNTWTAKASMPTARESLSVVALNGKFYAIGGSSNGSSLRKVEEYIPATNLWTALPDMPMARDGCGVAVANGKIYVIGGYDLAGGYLDTVEELDPATNRWRSRASMPTPRANFGVAASQGKIYAIGGENLFGYLDTLEEYDPASNTWTTRAAASTARTQLRAVSSGGKAYAIGGQGLGTDDLDVVEEYDPNSSTYYLIIRADDTSRVSGPLQSTRAQSTPITLRVPVPDLILTDATAPSDGVAGKPIPLSWTVRNQGTGGAASPWYDKLYLSQDPVWDGTDKLLTSVTRSIFLAAGSSYSVRTWVNLPKVSPGTYHLILRADDTHRIPELNDSDNVQIIPLILK
ncbi:MAG: hypothetical protein EPO21_16725 [Chloroflexota bacterium]|nr:MAG: hypothetical protein EPO21_16725 [Chloroflexota bacterium]